MADWWQTDPIAGRPSGTNAPNGSWWESDPVFGGSPRAAKLDTPVVEPELGPFGAGWKGAGSDLRTAGAAVASRLGFDEKAKELLETAEKSRAEVGRRYKPKVPSFTDIGGPGDLAQYVYEKGAESATQTGAALGAGALGFLTAPAAIPAAVAGVAAGTAAGLPFFVGQNIKEQMDEGKTLKDTGLGVATAAGAVQSALDTLVGKVLPGVGKAAAGGIILRAIKKGIEGGAIEGLTEGAQQAIQIGQANPSKLFEFGPEVQKELAENAIAGLALGASIGGAGGAAQRRKVAATSPTGEEPAVPTAPPAPPFYPNGTGLPGPFEPDPGAMFPAGGLPAAEQPLPYEPNRTGLPQQRQPWAPNPGAMFPEGNEPQPTPYDPNRTGLPQQREPASPFQPNPGAMFPEGADHAPYYPNGTGLPGQENPNPRVPFSPDRSVMFPPETGGGQKVFRSVQQMLLAARQEQMKTEGKAFANPVQINAMARLWKERYETLAKQKGTDPYEEFRAENLSVQQGETPLIAAAQTPAEVKQITKTPKGTEKAAGHLEIFKAEWNKQKAAGASDVDARKAANAAADAAMGKTLKQDAILDPVVRDTNFKNWAKGAPLVEQAAAYQGGPAVFKGFHGTTHTDINEVNPKAGDMIGALGQGFYTTTNPEDASVNYATRGGPDAEYRIKAAADQIAEHEGLDIDEATRKATERVLGPSQGTVMPVYVRMNNPMDTRQSGTSFSGRDYARLIKTINDIARTHVDEEINVSTPIEAMNQMYRATGHITAREAYDVLKRFGDVNPDKGGGGYGQFFQNVAKRMGYDGIIEPAGQRYSRMDGMTKDTLHIVPFEANQVKGQFNRGTFNESNKLMEQKGAPGPQGNITILPNAAVIRLFKTANPSTFVHESAHLWLEGLVRNAPHNRQIAHDVQAVRDWVKNDGAPFTEAQHEQFARGFEQYLRTGKSPTKALADLFQQFKDWLVKLYKQAGDIKTPDGKSVVVPENIQQVYDRLFAMSDAEANEGRSSPIRDDRPLPVRGTEQTLTQPNAAFQKWFGDSKVTDAEGRPLTVYHGTSKDKDFGSFKVGRHGAWFTTDPEAASQYAVENDSMGHRYEGGKFHKTNTAARVMPVNLRIEKPYEMTPADLKSLNRDGSYKKIQSDFFDGLRRQGYDGVKYPGGVWVALKYPNQIKSIHNRGTYSDSGQVLNQSRTFRQDATETPAQNPTSVYSVNDSSWQKIKRKTTAFFDPFSEVPEEAVYRDMRNVLSGNVYSAELAAKKAKTLFDKLSVPQKESVNSYFDTPSADPNLIPQPIRAETMALKNYINGPLKKSLIDANILPADVANKNDDAYLPRLYLKHLVESQGLKGAGARLAMASSKKRTAKTPDELLAMGEIKDPGVRTFHALFRTQRDLAVMDFLNKVAANGEWALPDSLVDWKGHKVTPQWLRDEADHIIQSRAPAEMNTDRRSAMKELAGEMRDAADKGAADLKLKEYDNTQYQKLPDSPDFGPLRGMIVRKQIAEDIVGTTNFVDPNNTWDKWFGDRNSKLTRGISLWKVLKVPLNPPSQMRNIASNMILLHLSGMPIHKLGGTMLRAATDMAKNGKYYQIAKKYGVGKGTFTEQELYVIADELKKLDANSLNGFAGWRAVYRGLLKAGGKMTDFHQKAEEWGKVAKIMDAMERQGMPENDAVREANKWLFDYSEADTFVKRARQSPLGMPFLTFQYKMAPLLWEIMTKHPTRLLPYIALAYTVPALVAAGNDIDEDDAEKLRKSLSSGLRRKNDMYLLPWKDDAGRWQFIDVGYFMPWQMPVDMARYAGQAAYKTATGETRGAIDDAGEAFRTSGLLSNPVLNIATALTTGIDPFTDKPIADKRDPPSKQVGDIAGYAWSLVAPSLFASYGALGQLMSRESGTGMNKYGEPQTTPGQIAARALGANVYPITPDAQRARNIQLMQHEIQDVKSRLTSSLKDRSLTAEQRRDVMDNFKEELNYRVKSLGEYIRDTAPSPRLAAATARP